MTELMTAFTILLTGLFLPLFPLSMGFNHLLGRIETIWLKTTLLIFWPLIGIILMLLLDIALPDWVLPWAAITALLYAYRLLTQRELTAWIGFLATSGWSLLWFPLALNESGGNMLIYALGFSIPLLLLLFLATTLQQRFGVAYTHLYNGLAEVMPRFSGLLIFVVLAAVATPVFPGFLVMLQVLTGAITLSPPLVSLMILLSWLLWSWAGIRVLQGLLVGTFSHNQTVTDLSLKLSRSISLMLALLALAGVFMIGSMA